MKRSKLKILACLTSISISCAAVAGGNGSGNEPPTTNKTGGSGFLCTIIPALCVTNAPKPTGGNGSGNEPD